MANEQDRELDLNELESVSGGYADHEIISNVTAYCKVCHKKLTDLGPRRIAGGTTNIFKCHNRNCKEFDKEKTNLEVDFP